MDVNNPGLRALGPADEPPVPPVPWDAAGVAQRLLTLATTELDHNSPRLGFVDVLGQVAQAWATLAQVEQAVRIADADERRNVLLEADAAERREAMARQIASDEERWRSVMGQG